MDKKLEYIKKGIMQYRNNKQTNYVDYRFILELINEAEKEINN